ncbi:CE1759 family FMN reductase [Nocardia stercoris]|uniref:Oxidoreductase n=1 Tax=Nocardia stercoris TaxID=2483361 RepID=A0A3M2L5L8_9NOCA|nr:CE1759 family FMN reductase [Nocardia stercoris]RMI32992.1 oxidoreductase [Nocardia stercoris]
MNRTVVVLTAGVSQPSSTRMLADQLGTALSAAVGARGEQIELQFIELRELAADLATTVTTGVATPAITAAREQVTRAAGIIAVTPVFAASYSGLFKMFVDILDPESINGMPVLIAATAGTERHALVLDHALRPLFTYLRAVVVPTGVFAATSDFGSTGLSERITRAAAELATQVVSVPTAVAGFVPDPSIRPRRSGNQLDAVTPFSRLLAGHTGDAQPAHTNGHVVG